MNQQHYELMSTLIAFGVGIIAGMFILGIVVTKMNLSPGTVTRCLEQRSAFISDSAMVSLHPDCSKIFKLVHTYNGK